MPKRVVFSFGEPSPEQQMRAEAERLKRLDAGLCGDCGHARHETFQCSGRIVWTGRRVCFGPNPHTDTEYGPCLCSAGLDGTRASSRLAKTSGSE
jgi:hypothetical protein